MKDSKSNKDKKNNIVMSCGCAGRKPMNDSTKNVKKETKTGKSSMSHRNSKNTKNNNRCK